MTSTFMADKPIMGRTHISLLSKSWILFRQSLSPNIHICLEKNEIVTWLNEQNNRSKNGNWLLDVLEVINCTFDLNNNKIFVRSAIISLTKPRNYYLVHNIYYNFCKIWILNLFSQIWCLPTKKRPSLNPAVGLPVLNPRRKF